MQYWKHYTIGSRVKEFIGMPGGGQWPGFGFAITHHTGYNQIGIIHHRAKGMA